MRQEKVIDGTPIYICESPVAKYREDWHGQLCEEMLPFFESLSEEILLRGSHEKNLDKIAQTGADQQDSGPGSLIYVVPYQHWIHSIPYPFGTATTAMLVYKASGLVERIGDAENMNVDHNRYGFIVPPKEALLGIIDLREIKRISSGLPSFWEELDHHLGHS